MKEKSNSFSIITIVLSLLLLGYVLFISVFNQIIAQNEGFFYMIVFGGILVLAFVLLSLITKLMAISHEVEENKSWFFIEIIAIIGLYVLFIQTRLAYTSSLLPTEMVFYKAAVLMNKGMLSVGGVDILPQLLRNPAQFMYAAVVSIVFMITGENPAVIVYINIAVLILTSFFVYRIARRIGSRTCGVLTIVCTLYMPSQAFSVYSYSPELFFSCVFCAALCMFVYIWTKKNAAVLVRLLCSSLLGILFGIILFMEPAAVIVLILLLPWLFCSSQKDWISGTCTLVMMLIVFVLCMFWKCTLLECPVQDIVSSCLGRFHISSNLETGEQYSFSQIMSQFHARFDNQNLSITDNYYFLTKSNGQTYTSIQAAWLQLGNQLLYLFLIVMSVSSVLYQIRQKERKLTPILFVLFGTLCMLFFSVGKESNTYFFVELLIVIGCCGLYYMYENHHPKELLETVLDTTVEEANVETQEEEAARLMRARALIFIGENEQLYYEIKHMERQSAANIQSASAVVKQNIQSVSDLEEQIIQTTCDVEEQNIRPAVEPTAQPEVKKVVLLDNPLPGPKKHVTKTLDYSISESEEADFDFDVSISEDDDFDV